jgi:trk system potassium uptake protein TrkA
MRKVRYAFKDTERRPHNIVIGGGGSTAFHLAKLLEPRSFHIRLVERDRARCDYLSRELGSTTILHGDVTRLAFLKEHLVEVDIFIAVCGDDQTNLIAGLLAKENGAKSITVVVNRSDFLPVIHKVGVDLAISPRILTATRILTLAGRGHISSVASLDNGKAEVLELSVSPKCKAAGGVLGKDLRLPKGSVLGAIVRGKEVTVPRGGTTIEPGDTVIAIALQGMVHEVAQLFE